MSLFKQPAEANEPGELAQSPSYSSPAYGRDAVLAGASPCGPSAANASPMTDAGALWTGRSTATAYNAGFASSMGEYSPSVAATMPCSARTAHSTASCASTLSVSSFLRRPHGVGADAAGDPRSDGRGLSDVAETPSIGDSPASEVLSVAHAPRGGTDANRGTDGMARAGAHLLSNCHSSGAPGAEVAHSSGVGVAAVRAHHVPSRKVAPSGEAGPWRDGAPSSLGDLSRAGGLSAGQSHEHAGAAALAPNSTGAVSSRSDELLGAPIDTAAAAPFTPGAAFAASVARIASRSDQPGAPADGSWPARSDAGGGAMDSSRPSLSIRTPRGMFVASSSGAAGGPLGGAAAASVSPALALALAAVCGTCGASAADGCSASCASTVLGPAAREALSARLRAGGSILASAAAAGGPARSSGRGRGGMTPPLALAPVRAAAGLAAAGAGPAGAGGAATLSGRTASSPSSSRSTDGSASCDTFGRTPACDSTSGLSIHSGERTGDSAASADGTPVGLGAGLTAAGALAAAAAARHGVTASRGVGVASAWSIHSANASSLRSRLANLALRGNQILDFSLLSTTGASPEKGRHAPPASGGGGGRHRGAEEEGTPVACADDFDGGLAGVGDGGFGRGEASPGAFPTGTGAAAAGRQPFPGLLSGGLVAGRGRGIGGSADRGRSGRFSGGGLLGSGLLAGGSGRLSTVRERSSESHPASEDYGAGSRTTGALGSPLAPGSLAPGVGAVDFTHSSSSRSSSQCGESDGSSLTYPRTPI